MNILVIIALNTVGN